MSQEIDKLLASRQRPGCEFTLRPRFLDLSNPLWTETEKKEGVTIRLYEATPEDERSAAALAGNSRSGGGIAINVTMAQAMIALGVVGARKVSTVDREIIWAALSTRGRSAVMSNMTKMNSVDEEDIEAMNASFRPIEVV